MATREEKKEIRKKVRCIELIDRLLRDEKDMEKIFILKTLRSEVAKWLKS